MERQAVKKIDKKLIVMALSLAYSVCVGVFAVIRYLNEEWQMAVLDTILAAFGLYVFFHVWYTQKAVIPAYAIALISVIGTLATLVLKGNDQVYWAYPSLALVFYLLPSRHATVLWGITTVLILVLLHDLPGSKLLTIAMTISITSFFCFFFSAKMEQQHNRLRRLANEDVLTQINNRRAFNKDSENLALSEVCESAILFDLDKFKGVNDRFGHATGDEVLKQVTRFILKQISCDSVLYRIGGDEFAILCFGRQFDYAYQLANKIHTEFKQSEVHSEHGITLSMAVAQKEPDESIDDWLGRLDSALYQAKKSGRDNIVKAIRH